MTPSFRMADEPVRFFGLELEDLVAAFLIFATGALLLPEARLFGEAASRILAVAAGAGFGVALQRIKRGKPRGYLRHALRRLGLEDCLPRGMRIRGAPPAPRILCRMPDRLRARARGRYEPLA